MILNKNDDIIMSILTAKGPLLSTELVEELTRLNSNGELSRQWIKRALKREKILRVENMTFKHNQYIYYLRDQNGLLKKKIVETINKYEEVSKRLISALIDNKFLFLEETLKIMGAPILKNPTPNFEEDRRTYHEAINMLVENEIIKIVNFQQVDEYIKFHPMYLEATISSAELEQRKLQLKLSKNILLDMLNILERTGFVGWNSSNITEVKGNSYESFNNYYFDAKAFSYTYDNFYIKNGQKMGMPVLIDVLLYRQTNIYDIVGFKIRIDNVKNKFAKGDIRKVNPVIFVSSIETEALKFARRLGIITINIKDIIGNNNLETMKAILKINLRGSDISDFEHYFNLISLDGRFNNVRGTLFNYMIVHLLKSFITNDLKISKEYEINGVSKVEKCECDIVFETEDTVFIFETKGYQKNAIIRLGSNQEDRDSVKRFFERTRSIVHKATHKMVVPIFITSSTFEKVALNYMENQKKIKNIFLRTALWSDYLDGELFIDRKKLLILATKARKKDIKKIINEYF